MVTIANGQTVEEGDTVELDLSPIGHGPVVVRGQSSDGSVLVHVDDGVPGLPDAQRITIKVPSGALSKLTKKE